MTSNATVSSQNVSRETLSLLTEYVNLLLKWNAKINLIGPATEADIWNRHIEDSQQLVDAIPSAAKTLADLGSGAGLPGMVIAITCPNLSVTLVEQDQRKAAFLTEAKRVLSLTNVTIAATDIATLKGTYDVITARALAPLKDLLHWTKPLLKQGSVCLFPKGENYAKEIEEARGQWQFSSQLKPSLTNQKSTIIILTELSER